MPLRLFATALALLALALSTAIALADDGYLGVAGSSVVPLQNTQVRMAAEHVTAEIRGHEAWVTCVFTFTNNGPATNVLMGFPQQWPGNIGRNSNSTELHDFTARVGGRTLPVEYRVQATATPEPTRAPATRAPTAAHAPPTPTEDDRRWWADRYKGWHTFTVRFGAGQTRVVTNTYHGPLGGTSIGDHFFEYELATGATWQGTIGDAVVEVHWRNDRDAAPGSIDGHPKGFAVGQRSLRWHFADFEPDREDNILANFTPSFGPGRWRGGEFWASTRSLDDVHEIAGDPMANLTDENPATAWLAAGDPEGARLTWTIGWVIDTYIDQIKRNMASATLYSSGVGFLPGVTGSERTAHGRPKDVRVRLASANLGSGLTYHQLATSAKEADFDHPPPGIAITERHLHLADLQKWAYVAPDVGHPIVGFEITIESVYPGTRYDDVAIAEVRFPVGADELATVGLDVPTTPTSPGRMAEPWRMLLPPAGRGADVGARSMRPVWHKPAPSSEPASRFRQREMNVPSPPTYLGNETRK